MFETTDLRPHQVEAAVEVEEYWDRGQRRILCCQAVGTGKTVLGAYLARMWGKLGLAQQRYGLPARVLWTAYTDEQIEQAAEVIEDVVGDVPAIEKAERSIRREPAMLGRDIVVTSVQTMMRPGRLEYFGPDDFGLIVADEAHHLVCEGYAPILERFPKAHIAGLTATPNRTDRVPLGKLFDAATPAYGLAEAMKDGWLCPLKYQQVHVESLDWSRAITESGLAEDRVAAIIEEEGDELHAICGAIVRHCENRPTLIYAPRVLAAEVIAGLLRSRYAPDAGAEFVSGSTPRDERREIVRRFRAGEIQFLANSAVFLEGTDLRNASAAVIAKPIRSTLRWEQMVGRILRGGERDPVPGKCDAIVVDLIGSSSKHKLVTPVDVLGGRWDACVRDEAQAWLEERAEVPVDVLALIDEAKAQAEEIRLRERRRVVAEIKSKVKTVDPFDLWPAAGADTEIDDGWWECRLADEGQVERLKAAGIPAKGVTYNEARKLLREVGRRREAGLCSYKASRQLQTRGISPDLTHEQACDLLQAFARTRFRPGPEDFRRRGAARRRGALYGWDELHLSYKVPLATDCQVASAGEDWRPFRTTKEAKFSRPAEHRDSGAVFELHGWRLLVPRAGYVVTLGGQQRRRLEV